jgi:hypothetical protein
MVLSVERSKIINMFTVLRCPKAALWSDNVLEGRVAAMYELFDPEMEIDNRYKLVYLEVIKASSKGDKIVIIDDRAKPVESPISFDFNDINSVPREYVMVEDTDDDIEVKPKKSKKGKKEKNIWTERKSIEDFVALVGEYGEEKAMEMYENSKKNIQQPVLQRYHDKMTEWGTWLWCDTHVVDEYFLSGNQGTIEQISEKTGLTKRSLQLCLPKLVQYGMIVYQDDEVFRASTREERITFVDYGVQYQFKPYSWMKEENFLYKKKSKKKNDLTEEEIDV